jgi:multidrug efflux pump subunit AcrB
MLPLWNFFLNKRQFTAILIAGLVVWGVSSAVFITKESAPEVKIPIGLVTTVLPGASSEDIERLVTDKIEDRLTNLPDLDKMTSSSKSGVSVVVVQFNASANIDKSIQKLKDEVDKAKPDLPEEAKAPNVSDVNFVDQPVQMISVSADLPFVSFAKLSDDLKRELQGVEGVSRVEVSGVRHREVQVVVRKENLSRYGISLPQVVGAIASANASLPAGSITVDNISYNINFEGSLDDVKDIGNIPLFPVGGEPIYLKDIASVSDGVEKATSYSRVAVSGKTSEQAMTLSIYKVRGYDVTKMTEAVRVKLDGLKNDLLKNSSVVITFDAGKEVKKDLRELTRTGLETIILVMLCLFASIGWKEAIVAGLSIPLSFLIAFIGLLYSGNTINFVSLFSLILAIGILVDSGIVVVEAIHTRSRIMGDRTEAARQALREYAWPLIGGTMTTVAVFVPLFFISGVTGKFIATIPFTIIAVLIASIFVSLGLIPILAVVFAKDDGHSDLNDKQEAYAIKAREWYANFLHKFFANEKLQKKFLWVMAGSFVLTLFLPVLGLLKVNFFPAEDGDFVYVDIELPPGSSLSQTDLATRALEEVLYGKKYADSLVTTVGATSQFSNNAQSGERYANLIVNLVDKSDRNKTSTEIVDEIKKDIEPLKMAKFKNRSKKGMFPEHQGPFEQTMDKGVKRAGMGLTLLGVLGAAHPVAGVGLMAYAAGDMAADFAAKVRRGNTPVLSKPGSGHH